MASAKKRALITGITGQDGAYLAEHLLELDYQVFGLVRRTSSPSRGRLEGFQDRIEFIEGDLVDPSSLDRAVSAAKPDEVYNLGAQSFVKTSFDQPVLTAQVTGLGVLNLLEAVRKFAPKARFYQASSSEMFGKVAETPQTETTPFHPRSPYGAAKTFGHYITINYREAYGMFAATGICFNHESPRRGIEFVTRKISDGVARIKLGLAEELVLGNLDARRDWGFAGDYVKAMRLTLQQDAPDDFVLATGETHTIQEFVDKAFAAAGVSPEGKVRQDPAFMRPAEVDLLLGDPSKARAKLGWKPEVDFDTLVRMMVESDLETLSQEKARD